MKPQLAFGIGMWELLVILIIVLIIFGGSRLPQLTESVAKSIKIFRRSIKEEPKEVEGEARRVMKEGEPRGQLESGESNTRQEEGVVHNRSENDQS